MENTEADHKPFRHPIHKTKDGFVNINIGTERNWKRITRTIYNAVAKGEMETTFHLKAAVESATHQNFVTKTLARVFQGIRIHVNGELDSLKMALEASPRILIKRLF